MSQRRLMQRGQIKPLEGTERVGPATVLDFWRWAMGDLQMNTARGLLVEWLVAQALGDPSVFRVKWGPYDVQAADGTKVEIKATGLMQGWAMKKPSTPQWTFAAVSASSVWAEDLGEYVPVDPQTRVDVWIFALHTATDQERYDPLGRGVGVPRDGASSATRHGPEEARACPRSTGSGASGPSPTRNSLTRSLSPAATMTRSWPHSER